MEIQDRCRRNQDGTYLVRKLNLDTEYEELMLWSDFWKFPRVPKVIYPETTFLLEEGGFKVCSCALYESKTGGISFTEWFIINPNTPKEFRRDCIVKLLLYISNYAKDNGQKLMFCSTNNKGLIKNLKKSGYQITDHNITNLLKGLT